MIKKINSILFILSFLLCAICIQEAHAQYRHKRNKKPKYPQFKTAHSFGKAQHTDGMKGVELGIGIGKNGYTSHVGFHYFLSNKWQTEITGKFEKGDFSGVDFQSYYLELGSAYTLFHLHDKFYFNGLAGASAVWDDLPLATEKRLEEEKYKSDLGMGAFLGLGCEWFFHHQWALVLKGQQQFYFNNTFGHQRFFASTGLKFSF